MSTAIRTPEAPLSSGAAGLRVTVRILDPRLRAQVHGLLADVGVDQVERDPDLTILGPDDAGPAVAPALMVGRGDDRALWRQAARVGVMATVPLPDGEQWLRGRLADLIAGASRRESTSPSANPAVPGRLVLVTGTRGGCGATTIAVGVARALQAVGAVALVDLDHHGPGIELSLGAETGEGARWADLAHIDRQVRGETLTRRLPRSDGLAVLSHRVPCTAPADVMPVLDALREVHDWVVADAPRYIGAELAKAVLARRVLVVPRDLAGVTAAADRFAEASVAPPVVMMTHSVGPLSRAAVLGALPEAVVLEAPRSRVVAGAADFGDLGQAVTRGRFGGACSRLAELLASG